MDKLRFGIVGLGFISSRHIDAIRKVGGELVWGCDIDPQKIYAGAKFTTDYRDITDVDYVAICTPNDTHFEMAKYFTDKGIKVILEKPPVIKLEDLQELKDRDINVMLQLRYHPEISRLKSATKEGHMVSMKIVVKRDQSYWESWKGDEKRSGGILYNLGIHYLDALLQNYGENHKVHFVDITPDYAYIELSLGSNYIKATIQTKYDAIGQTREIIHDGRKFQFSNQDNLSFEDLHTKAYEEILAGRGFKLKECGKLLTLIDEICQM